MLAGVEEFILRGGALAGALVVIVGSIAALLRFSTKHFVASVESVVERSLEDVRRNTQELRPNGGSSVNDAIRRIEARQLQIDEKTDAVRNALIEHLVEHKGL